MRKVLPSDSRLITTPRMRPSPCFIDRTPSASARDPTDLENPFSARRPTPARSQNLALSPGPMPPLREVDKPLSPLTLIVAYSSVMGRRHPLSSYISLTCAQQSCVCSRPYTLICVGFALYSSDAREFRGMLVQDELEGLVLKRLAFKKNLNTFFQLFSNF